jgi:hypothetical protein
MVQDMVRPISETLKRDKEEKKREIGLRKTELK